MKTKVLAIAMIVFGFVVNAQKNFIKDVTVSKTVAKELTDSNGNSLPPTNTYKIRLVTRNTGTVTGSEYLAWPDNSQWRLRAVNLRGTTSNHPILIIDNNIIKVKTNHANSYSVRAFVTELETATTRPSGTIFGSSSQWQREVNNLFYTDGNVGIGTNTPDSKLDVNGIITAKNEVRSKSSNPAILLDETDVADKNWHMQVNSGDLKFYEVNDARSSWSQRMVIKPTTGNVGIGTNTPSEKLEVKSDKNARIRLESTSTTHSSGISFRGKRDNSSVFSSHYIGTDGDSHYNLKLIADENMKFQTNSTVKMIINGNGNVGIGTESIPSQYKLAVAGKMISEEVKVQLQSNWPDFVFKKDYKLPTLTEVENHIKEKGHLENIPSAETVKKEGFFLGKMDAKLLQKIEELTLYTINQEKKLETQNTKIEKLEKQNAVLKSLLKRVSKLEKRVMSNE